jgi:hypothetical protein
MILENLKIKGFDFDESALAISESFVSLYTYKPGDDLEIKVDFVNDIAVRYGEFNASPIYPKTDNIRNILSNKIGAVFRLSGKDIADIREIALHEKFDWAEVLIEARNKDMGVEANIISEIIAAIPKSAFESIAWVTQPSWSEFMKDIETISEDLIHCSQNSLVQ